MYREYYKLFFCKHSNVMNGIFFLTLELMTKIQAWDTKRYPILINLKRTANNGTHLPDVIKWWLNPFLLNNLHKPFHLVAQAGMGKVEGNRNKIAGVVGKDCYFFPAFPNANLGRRDSWRGACKKKKGNWYFMSNPLQPHELDYLPEFAQIHVHWIGDAIQLSHRLSPTSLVLNLSQHQVFSNESTLPICGQSIAVSASALPKNIQSEFPLGLIDLLAFKGLSESSPEPQFESTNSSVLRLLYGPILTSVHDYWKTHSFDYMDLCQQSDVSAF